MEGSQKDRPFRMQRRLSHRFILLIFGFTMQAGGTSLSLV
jgi:hypothetical protein